MLKTLENIVDETFPAIQQHSARHVRATRVGKQTYHSWQSVRYQNCNCSYDYAGTVIHKLYHYMTNDENVVHDKNQPDVVNQLLEEIWSKKGILAPQENKFPHARKHCPMNALIVNKYENGDTIAAHNDQVKLSSKGRPDDLHTGTVVTDTLRATGVFFIEPNKETRSKIGVKKQKHNLDVKGRVAKSCHIGRIIFITIIITIIIIII